MSEKEVPYDKLKEAYLQLLSKNKGLKQNLEKSIKNCESMQKGVQERDQMIETRNKSISDLVASRDQLQRQCKEQQSQIEFLNERVASMKENSSENEPQNNGEMPGELVEAFNSERRELIGQIEKMKTRLEELSNVMEKNMQLEEELKEKSDEIQSINEKLSKSEQQNEFLSSDIELKKKVIEEHERFKEEAQKAMQSSDEGKSQLLEKMVEHENAKKEIARITEENQKSAQIINDLNEAQNLLRSENQQQKEKIQANEENLIKLREEIESLTKQNESLEETKTQLSEKSLLIEQLESQLNEFKDSNAQLMLEFTAKKQEIEKQQEEITQLKNTNTNCTNEISALTAKIQSIMAEKSGIWSNIALMQQENRELAQNKKHQAEQIESLREEVDTSLKRISELETANNSSKSEIYRCLSEKKKLEEFLNDKDKIVSELSLQIDNARANDKQQTNTLQLKINELMKEKEEFDDKLSSALTKNDELTRIIQMQSDELVILRTTKEVLSEKAKKSDENESAKADLEEQLRVLKEENEQNKEELAQCRDASLKLHKSENDLTRTKEKLDEVEKSLKAQEEQAKLDADSYEKREKQLNDIINSLETGDAEKTRTIQQLSATLSTVQISNEENARTATDLTSRMQAAEKIRSQLEIELDELKEKAKRLELESNEEKTKAMKFLKARDKLEQAKRSADKKIQTLDEENSQLKSKITALQNDRGSPKDNQSTVFPFYIRKVLLQFFTKDGAEREALIPIILKLVECDTDQITMAQRCYAESTQVISQAFSFFKRK